jgi:hypothetical protein
MKSFKLSEFPSDDVSMKISRHTWGTRLRTLRWSLKISVFPTAMNAYFGRFLQTTLCNMGVDTPPVPLLA